MESHFTIRIMLLFTILSSVKLIHVSCFEFQVGDRAGWIVPPTNHTKFYNDWASEKRFKIGDIIRFNYRKDSVMEVSETEYKNCNTTRPTFFSNTGDTIFTLDRHGFFYFISGSFGHCQRGQKIIVRVVEQDQVKNATSSASRNPTILSYKFFVIVFVFLCLA
ncbi:early nodulin 1 [Olea europaea subsp. europaea]|uniref:Early nodulin 1 n=1 Tax=Olea europaea subsp. europaea TaxID=158383 RepID=A0A8S0UH61_OLEEU|nr:early nodulin 1 [Olea europaea subsp. europaea]